MDYLFLRANGKNVSGKFINKYLILNRIIEFLDLKTLDRTITILGGIKR